MNVRITDMSDLGQFFSEAANIRCRDSGCQGNAR